MRDEGRVGQGEDQRARDRVGAGARANVWAKFRVRARVRARVRVRDFKGCCKQQLRLRPKLYTRPASSGALTAACATCMHDRGVMIQ